MFMYDIFYQNHSYARSCEEAKGSEGGKAEGGPASCRHTSPACACRVRPASRPVSRHAPLASTKKRGPEQNVDCRRQFKALSWNVAGLRAALKPENIAVLKSVCTRPESDSGRVKIWE